MKKVILIVLVLLLAGGGYFWYWKSSQATAATTPTTTAKVERGSLRQSVFSTGKVVSNLDVDIKCKASGEIILVSKDVSASVAEGELLMQLDPKDEERNVLQAKVNLDSSLSKVKIAEKNLRVAEMNLKTDRMKAEVAIQACQARADDARSKADRSKRLLDSKMISAEENETAQTTAVQAAVDLNVAKVRLEELKTQEESLELLRSQMAVAQSQVDSDQNQLSVAHDRLADTKVFAPVGVSKATSQPASAPAETATAGLDDAPARATTQPANRPVWVVSTLNVQKGNIISSAISNVGGGTTAFTLSDMSQLFVLASVDESDIGKIRLEMPVALTLDAFQGKTFTGKVVRIATKGVNISNVVTFEVKILVKGVDDKKAALGLASSGPTTTASEPATGESSRPRVEGRGEGLRARADRGDKDASGGAGQVRRMLKPEMTANVEIICQERPDVVLAPADAIVRKSGKTYATIAKDGVAKDERAVKAGLSDGQKTEILEGLSEGDTVVVFRNQADSRFRADQQRNPNNQNPARVMGGGGPRGR